MAIERITRRDLFIHRADDFIRPADDVIRAPDDVETSPGLGDALVRAGALQRLTEGLVRSAAAAGAW